MDRNLTTFNEAQDRVKIGHFTKQGYDITGLVHVGANDGYEIEFYLKMGIKPILAFEPLDSARKIMFQKYKDHPDIQIYDSALGNLNCEIELNVALGDGKGSSFLLERNAVLAGSQLTEMNRWAALAPRFKEKFNCCVIDVQGMELDVLRGMDDQIQQFDLLSVECSNFPMYRGEASAQEVINYLDQMGFQCDTDIIPAHDDVFFINRRVLHPPEPEKLLPRGHRLNIGSGQRRFDNAHGWINVDCVSRPGQVPDLLLDVGREQLPYEDNSMSVVVLHHVYEHFGCGEGHALLRECHRVLRPDGSLIVTVPDMRALAQRWIAKDLEDFLYFVNVYGAYQGEDGDRHKWGYYFESLYKDLRSAVKWASMTQFNFRPIAGADIVSAWWILGMEAFK